MGRTVIALEDVFSAKSTIARPIEGKREGCPSQACGTAPMDANVPPEILARIQDHPCYNEDAHHYFARMHVAVAPACNIQCHYCNRKYDCANESRPRVVSERLSPDEGVRKVLAVAERSRNCRGRCRRTGRRARRLPAYLHHLPPAATGAARSQALPVD